MSAVERRDRLVADELRASSGRMPSWEMKSSWWRRRRPPMTSPGKPRRGARRKGLWFSRSGKLRAADNMARRWESALNQGLWFSVLLRPRISLSESPQLTSLLAGATAATIIEGTGCAASIKTPNDIFAAGRKIAGVLVEGRTTSDGRYVAVAGVGVNVNQAHRRFSNGVAHDRRVAPDGAGPENPPRPSGHRASPKVGPRLPGPYAGRVARNC